MYQTISPSSLAFLSMQRRSMSFRYEQILFQDQLSCVYMSTYMCVCVYVHSCVTVPMLMDMDFIV